MIGVPGGGWWTAGPLQLLHPGGEVRLRVPRPPPRPPPHHSAQPGGQAWPGRPLQVSKYRVPGPPPPPLFIILLNQEVRLGLGVLYRSVHAGSLDIPLPSSSSFCSTRRSGLASASSTDPYMQGPWTSSSPPPHHSAQPGGQAWPRRPLQVSKYRVPGPPPCPLLIILLNQEVRLGLGVLYRSVHAGSLDLLLAPSSSFCSTTGQTWPRRPLQLGIYRDPGPPPPSPPPPLPFQPGQAWTRHYLQVRHVQYMVPGPPPSSFLDQHPPRREVRLDKIQVTKCRLFLFRTWHFVQDKPENQKTVESSVINIWNVIHFTSMCRIKRLKRSNTLSSCSVGMWLLSSCSVRLWPGQLHCEALTAQQLQCEALPAQHSGRSSFSVRRSGQSSCNVGLQLLISCNVWDYNCSPAANWWALTARQLQRGALTVQLTASGGGSDYSSAAALCSSDFTAASLWGSLTFSSFSMKLRSSAASVWSSEVQQLQCEAQTFSSFSVKLRRSAAECTLLSNILHLNFTGGSVTDFRLWPAKRFTVVACP